MGTVGLVRALLLLGGAVIVAVISLPLKQRRSLDRGTALYRDQLVVKCELTKEFVEGLNSLIGQKTVDMWGVDKDKKLHIRLGSRLWAELQSSRPECDVAIDNLEDYMAQAEMASFSKVSDINEPEGNSEADEWFQNYHDYADMVDWYERLQKNYSSIVTFVTSIGKSSEGRDIPAIHIKGSETSPIGSVYFQCLIHAREWISGPVCMYIARDLCRRYEEKEEQVTRLLDKLEFIVVPIVNPDGYEYTWTDDRLWRKNRANIGDSECRGVDLNRNFNDHWNEGGSSEDPCSEIYCGTEPASEPETTAIQNYFMDQNKIIAAVDWHSYSQLILRPSGWSKDPSPDEDMLRNVSDHMSALINTVHGEKYISQRIWDLYQATGGASDWFYGENATIANDGYRAAGITIELRDTGDYGFHLPPEQIIPTVQEVTPAFLLFAEEMLENPITSSPID